MNDLYICPECGHGRHLYAWFDARIMAAVLPSGNAGVTLYDEPGEIFVGSIACEVHGPDIAAHVLIDGVYHRWQTPCGAPGYRDGKAGTYYNSNCSMCNGTNGRYVPVDDRGASLLTSATTEATDA